MGFLKVLYVLRVFRFLVSWSSRLTISSELVLIPHATRTVQRPTGVTSKSHREWTLCCTNPLAMFPIKVVAGILKHVYLSCAELAGLEKHFCSLKSPCVVASRVFGSFFTLRLVSPSWNDAIQVICSSEESAFFSRVEHAYYPHAWHINTKVRKSILLNRYRVFYTISTEYGKFPLYPILPFHFQ